MLDVLSGSGAHAYGEVCQGYRMAAVDHDACDGGRAKGNPVQGIKAPYGLDIVLPNSVLGAGEGNEK